MGKKKGGIDTKMIEKEMGVEIRCDCCSRGPESCLCHIGLEFPWDVVILVFVLVLVVVIAFAIDVKIFA